RVPRVRDATVFPLQRRPRARDVPIFDRLPGGAVLRAADRPLLDLKRLLAALCAALLLAACSDGPKFKASDVTGASFGREFTLADQNGKTRSLSDFRGKAVVVFFGYTQCPDVCPTTMTTLAETMKQLGPDADRVQVIFITVDPDRDTQALL